MTWLQILAQAGVIASILGCSIAIAAYFNGKHIKESTTKMDERAEQRHKEIMEIIKQMHRDIIALLKKGFGGVMRKLQ